MSEGGAVPMVRSEGTREPSKGLIPNDTGSIDVKEKMLTKAVPIEVISAPSEEEAIHSS